MSGMNSHESMERIDQGLLRAASCCRELCVMTKINSWVDLSRQLLLMRKKAKVMYEGAPLSEVQVQVMVTNLEIAQIAAGRLREMHG